MVSPSDKPFLMDNLPLPATLGFLQDKAGEGEVIQIGNKIFTKVMCAGVVVSHRLVHSLNSVEYVISDTLNSAESAEKISVLHHEEVSSSEEQVDYMTGASVFVSGKLIRFKGSVAIEASFMRKIISPDEYECLKIEAFLALQFHIKNPTMETPTRRSLPGCADPPTVQSPLSAPPTERSSSTYTPTPKRPNVAGSTLPSRTAVATAKREATDKSPTRQNDYSALEEDHDGAIGDKEVFSQESFEDAVF